MTVTGWLSRGNVLMWLVGLARALVGDAVATAGALGGGLVPTGDLGDARVDLRGDCCGDRCRGDCCRGEAEGAGEFPLMWTDPCAFSASSK